MKHLSVGEGAPFGFGACRGAADLARRDAERSEWLAKRAKEVMREDRLEPLVCETEGCGAVLTENSRSTLCPRCRNREAMRQARGSVRTYAKRGDRSMVKCGMCGALVLKWGKTGKDTRPRKVCDECVPKARATGAAIRDGEMIKGAA